MTTSSLFHGIISGDRRRGHDEVAARADRIASGLHSLGVTPGDSVCLLMRNDIAFIESAYATMRLGAYGVPINWHFKTEEINYVLVDSGTRVLIAHADMLHGLREAIPAEVTVLRMIVGGMSNKEIAFALDLSENTVKTHVQNIFGKIGVSDRTSAATTAIKRGLVRVDL